MTGKRILVVDDEPDVTELVAYRLRREGHTVEVLNEPLAVMGRLRDFNPDLVVLDVMMPELDGLKICRMIRTDKKLKSVPIIFLSARGEAEDRIRGLESGADDYLPKPFDSKELALRVGLVLRRVTEPRESGTGELAAGGLALNDSLHRVTLAGTDLELTATEFKLLKLLLQHKGRVQTRQNLLVNVWQYDTGTETRTIDTHIRRLREKLGPAAAMIETVRGVGYRLNDPDAGDRL